MNEIRVRLVQLMDATVRNQAGWHYAQFRPCGSTVTYAQAISGTVWGDCSSGYAIICRLAGAPNPLHAGEFDGFGNSATAWEHLPHIEKSEAQVGDACIYGPWGDHHISVVRTPGSDPLLWSFGREGAPELIRASTQDNWQPSPVTWARLMAPDPKPLPPPPEDAYWRWLRWWLGEGEFKKFGPRNRKHRPKDLPERIPMEWWRRAVRFNQARRHMLP